MANISVSLPSDGETVDVADYNTPINTIVNEINGGLDNSNIAAAAAIAGSKLADASLPNAKLATGAGEPGGAWTSWTPTWTNLTVGNGTLTARYTQVGKTIRFRIALVFGSTTSISGAVSHSLPATAATHAGSLPINGYGSLLDSGIAAFPVYLVLTNTTTASVRTSTASGTYTGITIISATIPFTFSTNDEISITGEYEAA